MPEHAAVLFANDAFYLAFANRDIDAMKDIWAHDAAITCIHPGWEPLMGREEVMESMEAILGNSPATNITCKNPSVRVFGDWACVICYEVLDQGYLAATNIFVHEEGQWRIIHHQAGTAPPLKPTEDDPTEIIQ